MKTIPARPSLLVAEVRGAEAHHTERSEMRQRLLKMIVANERQRSRS